MSGVKIKDKEDERSVRMRLIRAGLRELGEHGIGDFSLRRVAVCAQVSCAAPYRHFRDKDDLIFEIIGYMCKDWLLLCDSICEIYRDSANERLLGLAASMVRFWIGNGNFHSALLAIGQNPRHSGELLQFDTPIIDACQTLSRQTGIEAEDLSLYTLSLVYGAVSLISSGRVSADVAQSTLRKHLKMRIMEKKN